MAHPAPAGSPSDVNSKGEDRRAVPRPFHVTSESLPDLTGRWTKTLVDRLGDAPPASGRLLLSGERGTGKRTIALCLHAKWHPNTPAPLEIVDCAGRNEDDLRVALFGTEGRSGRAGRGLYWPGALEKSTGGTALVLHVDDAPVTVREDLKRSLAASAVAPLAGDARRIILGCVMFTTRSDDVARDFEQQGIRRIDVIPLRDRRGDSEDIFWSTCREHGFSGFPIAAAAHFAAREWPGNVAELRAEVLNEMRYWLRACATGETDRVGVEQIIRAAWQPAVQREGGPAESG
jgi:transcriptional regulator with AAA-type ATPase domain